MAVLNENTFSERPRFVLTLLNGATITTSSDWQWVGGFQPVTISVEGDYNGSVMFLASLRPGGSGPSPTAPTGPDANYPTLLPNGTVTGPQMLMLPNSVQWIKAVVTFGGGPSGACYAYASVG
jgi:hypothetical protein